MGLFTNPGGSNSDSKDGKPTESAVLPPHKDPGQINPGQPKDGGRGGARPGSGRPVGTPNQPRAVALVPKKPEVKVTPEIVRPFAELPHDLLCAVMDTEAFSVEEDQAQTEAVYMAGAINDLGIEISHAPVYAYLICLGSSLAAGWAKFRAEKKANEKTPLTLTGKDDVRPAA